MIILGVLVDTLQPPHVGIKQAYEYISKIRGPQYTYIIATEKKHTIQSDITEPLSYQDKEQILIKHGIQKDKIVKGKSFFDTSEIERRFDPTDTVVVFYFFSDKIHLGFKSDKILPWYEMYVTSPKFQQELKPMSEAVYYQVLPNNIKQVRGLNLTTKLFIEELGDPNNQDDNKKTFFALAFGWYDAGFYNLIKERFSQPYEKLISKYSTALSQPSMEKTIQEIVKVLTEDFSSMISDTGIDEPIKSPTEKAKEKTDNVVALRQKQKTLDLTKKQVAADSKLGKEKVRKMTKDFNDDKFKVAKGDPISTM